MATQTKWKSFRTDKKAQDAIAYLIQKGINVSEIVRNAVIEEAQRIKDGKHLSK